MSEQGTHYRKVFNSPYLSAADVPDPIILTIVRVSQDLDQTKKTKLKMNTAYFLEAEIRPGEKLKPMILNATNSKMMDKITGTPYIEGWRNVQIRVESVQGIKFGSDVVDGLRISPAPARKTLTPDQTVAWGSARAAALRDGHLDNVLARVDMSQEHIDQMVAECTAASKGGAA